MCATPWGRSPSLYATFGSRRRSRSDRALRRDHPALSTVGEECPKTSVAERALPASTDIDGLPFYLSVFQKIAIPRYLGGVERLSRRAMAAWPSNGPE
jgi:hypothetical protein